MGTGVRRPSVRPSGKQRRGPGTVHPVLVIMEAETGKLLYRYIYPDERKVEVSVLEDLTKHYSGG